MDIDKACLSLHPIDFGCVRQACSMRLTVSAPLSPTALKNRKAPFILQLMSQGAHHCLSPSGIPLTHLHIAIFAHYKGLARSGND